MLSTPLLRIKSRCLRPRSSLGGREWASESPLEATHQVVSSGGSALFLFLIPLSLFCALVRLLDSSSHLVGEKLSVSFLDLDGGGAC